MLDEKIMQMKDDIIKGVQASVRIKSVEEPPLPGMPFGKGVHESLEHCLQLSKTLGFDAVNMDNMIGYAEYGQGDEMVAVLGHLDVVPEGEGWTYPPYAAEIHDGKIIGRGTTDDKGPTIGALYALKAIEELNIPLKRRVRIFFGLNEETGARGVKHYVANGGEMPVCGFTPDAEYPIINGEKGIVNCRYQRAFSTHGDFYLGSITGGLAVNVVPDHAQAVIVVPAHKMTQVLEMAEKADGISAQPIGSTVKINSTGINAHAATPEKGHNAITQLLLFLDSINMPGDAGEFLRFFAKNVGADINGRALGIFCEDDVSGLFTFNLGVINGDEKGIEIGMNMRYPVTHTYEEFISTFEEKMALGKLSEVSRIHKPCLYISPDTPFIKKLQKVYEEKTGETADLISIGGGTYAKAMPNVVAFGPIFKGQPMVEHKPDEYIKIDELLINVQIMAAAIVELAN